MNYILSGSSAIGAPSFSWNYHRELGVKPFINAIGPYSSLGGEEMWPKVIDAMDIPFSLVLIYAVFSVERASWSLQRGIIAW